MNLFGLHIHLPATAAAAASLAAPVVLPKTTEAVAALVKSPLGATVAAEIKAVADQNLTGEQKHAAVVVKAIPLLVDLLASGGVKATEDEVKDTAHLLVDAVHNDTRSTTAGTIATALLTIAASATAH